MNKTYRLVWNELISAWVVASEITRARGKRTSTALLLAAAPILLAPLALAQTAPPPNTLPTGGSVVAGSASISQSGATMTINQASQRAVIDWSMFNVGASATVNFIQSSRSAATLNRVLDANPSQIFGRIIANGQVFFTNPSGIYFGRTANINVGALTATTHSIRTDDFMAGQLNFSRNGAAGSVINDGNITADINGYVALLAPEVRNNGVIFARLGTVALAAGEAYELQFDGSRLANIRVEPATIRALVENGNAVQAPGGLIILSAQAANRLHGGVVNNSGNLEATGLAEHGGTVRLTASDRINHSGRINVDMGPGVAGSEGTATLIADLGNPESVTEVNGAISARGGFVETSASHLRVSDGSQVQAAQWLLDPTNITVESSGSASDLTGSSISATLIANTLNAGTGVTLDASNDITVTQAIAWSQSLLTMRAGNDLNIYSTLTPTGTSTLNLGYGYNGSTYGNGNTTVRYAPYTSTSFRGRVDFGARTGTGFLTINGNAYYVTNTVGDYWTDGLSKFTNTNIAGYAKDYLAIGSDLNASGWTNAYAIAYSVASGRVVDGLGHTISNATITNPSQYTGVFGSVAGTLRNIGFSTVNIGNAANMGYGSIGAIYAGGLVSGVKLSGTNTFYGQQMLGGLAGYNSGTLKEYSITGNVLLNPNSTNNGTAGGAIGQNETSGVTSYGYSNAAVYTTQTSTKRFIGGFVGRNRGNASYLQNAGTMRLPDDGTGTVIAFSDTVGSTASGFGGIIGENGNHGSASTAVLSNSDFSGTITAGNNAGFVGGLVGFNHATITGGTNSGTITVGNSAKYIGGIAGANWDQWNANVITVSGGAKFTGTLTTGSGAQYIGGITGYEGGGGTNAVTVNAADSNGTISTGSSSTYVGGIVGDNLSGASVSSSNSSSAVSINGTAASDNVGVSSPYLGKLIGYNGGTVSGNAFLTPITVSTSPITITYGATPTFTFSLISGSLTGTDTLSTILSGIPLCSACLNAGSYAVLAGTTAATSGYRMTWQNGSLVVNKAHLTVTASDAARVYGETNPTLTTVVSGFVNGESAASALGFGGSGSATTTATSTSAVGSATITAGAGTLSATNYDFTNLVNGTLTITQRPINITANASQSKVYGENDPTLSYTLEATGSGRGLVGTDTFSGAPARAAGENVGSTYAISRGSLANGNYAITFNGDNFAITQRPINITANANQSKVYGENDPTLSYTLEATGSGRGLVGTDTFSGAPARAAGENVGSTYAISRGSLANGNYAITFNGDNFTITRRPVTVTADAKSKTQGELDPSLTYQSEASSAGRGLLNGDILSGQLTRISGETVGAFAISQGTVNNANNGNYNIAYVRADLTIQALPVTDSTVPPPPVLPPSVLPSPSASPAALAPATDPTAGSPSATAPSPSGTQIAGTTAGGSSGETVTTPSIASAGLPLSAAAPLTSGGPGSATSGGISVALVRESSPQQVGVITVSVPREMATAGTGFSFPLPAEVFANAAVNAPMSITTSTGGALPVWLKFVPETRTFTASAVPDGAFPIQVTITIDGLQSTVVISERSQ